MKLCLKRKNKIIAKDNTKFVLVFCVILIIFLPTQVFCQEDETDELIAKYSQELKSSYEAVRLNAVKQLSKILDRKVVTPLIYALNDESKFVRKEACTGLGNLKHPRAVKPLGLLLLREDEIYVKRECTWALGNMGFVEAIPYLEKQLKTEESLLVIIEIKKALKKLYD